MSKTLNLKFERKYKTYIKTYKNRAKLPTWPKLTAHYQNSCRFLTGKLGESWYFGVLEKYLLESC